MEPQDSDTIPLTLVTGFLGSGKTTLLQRIAEQERHRRIAYLVNEFADTDIDGQRIRDDSTTVVTLSGGSIFCRCLVTEFVRELMMVPLLADEGAPFEAVVIEASGIANPMAIETLLHETRLDRLYRIASIVSIVDPTTFPVVVQTLPNIWDQIAASHVVIINKIDCSTDAKVARAAELVRAIKPSARILCASHCHVPVDLFAEIPAQGIDGPIIPCQQPAFSSFSLSGETTWDVAAVRDALAPYEENLLRLKGTVVAAGSASQVDWDGARWHERPALPGAPAQLVAIVRSETADELRSLLEMIFATSGGHIRS